MSRSHLPRLRSHPRRTCWVAPRQMQAIGATLARPVDYSADRMPASTPSSLQVDSEAEGRGLLTGEGPVAWRSIFTAKGLDAPAVVVTDVTAEAAAWADEHNLSWNDLLYVGMTRARYACTVLRGEGAPWRLASDRMHVPHREGVRVLGGSGTRSPSNAGREGVRAHDTHPSRRDPPNRR